MKTADEGIQLHFHIDREGLNDRGLPSWLVGEISQQRLTTGLDGNAISFCGLLMQDDDIRIFLPGNVSVPTDRKACMELAVLMTSCCGCQTGPDVWLVDNR